MKTVSRCIPFGFKPLLSGVVALSVLGGVLQAQAAPQQAFKADDFVETVGVCTPFQSWSDAQWAIIKPQLGALGVRYFRAGLEHVDNPTNLARLQSLRSDYGMKVLAIVGPYSNGGLQPINGNLNHIPGKVAVLKPMLYAVEGPNEPDIFWYDPWNYGGFTNRWDQVLWYQNTLYDAIKNDSRTSDVMVSTFALGYGNSGGAAFDGKTIKHDLVGWHYYNGRYQPTPWQLDYERNMYKSNKPAILTEHGYQQGPVSNPNSVSAKAQMKLDTRSTAYFFNWNNNQKMFFYVAGPNPSEQFGLNNDDNTVRPVYNALKGVLQYMSDASWNSSTQSWNRGGFTPGSLDYSVANDNGQVTWKLFQKFDGSFYLMGLPNLQVANSSDGSDITNAPINATLNFASNQKVVQYKCDDNGNYSESTLTNGATSVGVAIPDSLVIYKITSPSNVLFSTNFEPGQPQPTWNDWVDFWLNIGGFQAGVNPECSTRTNEPGISGTALMFSGRGTANNSYAYYKVFSVNIPVSAATTLSYDIYPQYDNARYVGVDLLCSDGTSLRDSGAVDSNGISFHPKFGHGGNIPLNAWTTIRGTIGNKLGGKTITKIWVAFDRPTNANAQYRGYIDNIKIQ